MLGNFSYSNPTKLYFGEESLCSLNEELPKYGKTVQLIYGGGSIKKNGIYNQVMRLLKDNEKVVVEDGGVMPNPTVEKPHNRKIKGGCSDCQRESCGLSAGCRRRLLLRLCKSGFRVCSL